MVVDTNKDIFKSFTFIDILDTKKIYFEVLDDEEKLDLEKGMLSLLCNCVAVGGVEYCTYFSKIFN